MKRHKVYVCGRCGTRSHSRIVCHRCHIHLEEQCKKCLNAKGNCVCRIHGVKIRGHMVKVSLKKR